MSKSSIEKRRLARQHRNKIKKGIFSFVVLLVLGLSAYLLKQAFFRPPPPPMAGNVIDIAADMAGFSQAEIRVKAGEAVTVRLESLDNQHHTDGGGKHQFAIEELGVDIVAQPLSTNYSTFTPETPGTYTFYCDICCGGKANPTMSGTFIVEA